MTRNDIIAEARTWRGTPWVHQQCTKGAGVDCLHYIAGVVRKFQTSEAERFFANPLWQSYGRHPNPEMFYQGCDELMDRIPITDILPGDVMVFRIGRHPMHFGFLSAPDMVIHAWLGANRVVEHQLDDKWRSRIIRTYRIRGIE